MVCVRVMVRVTVFTGFVTVTVCTGFVTVCVTTLASKDRVNEVRTSLAMLDEPNVPVSTLVVTLGNNGVMEVNAAALVAATLERFVAPVGRPPALVVGPSSHSVQGTVTVDTPPVASVTMTVRVLPLLPEIPVAVVAPGCVSLPAGDVVMGVGLPSAPVVQGTVTVETPPLGSVTTTVRVVTLAPGSVKLVDVTGVGAPSVPVV
jgi:hypothetical protein